jgi:hypothetical protein
VPKLIEEDSRFRFYWGEGESTIRKDRADTFDIKVILKELIA